MLYLTFNIVQVQVKHCLVTLTFRRPNSAHAQGMTVTGAALPAATMASAAALELEFTPWKVQAR